MKRLRKSDSFPKIEFFYIDRATDYRTVKHDYYSGTKVAAERFTVFFDDYGPAYSWRSIFAEEKERLPSLEIIKVYKTIFNSYFEARGRIVSPAPEELYPHAQHMVLAANVKHSVYEKITECETINSYLKSMKSRTNVMAMLLSKIGLRSWAKGPVNVL